MPKRESSFTPQEASAAAEALNSFFCDLWTTATASPDGNTATVIRVIPQSFQRYPDLLVNLPNLLTQADIGKWGEMTKRLLVSPERHLKGLCIREANIQTQNRPLRIPPDEPLIEIPLKYSFLDLTVDLEAPTNSYFPPLPSDGRSQLKIGAIEIFTDTRRNLLEIYSQLLQNSDSQENAQVFGQRGKALLLETISNQNPLLSQAIELCSATPFMALSLLARKTYYDQDMRQPQPVNTAGILLIEALDGSLALSRLAPWQTHTSWQPLPDPISEQVIVPYHQTYQPLIDANLRRIAKEIS